MRLVLAFSVLLSGCDPGWKIEGTVVDSAGSPIAGASVALACPGGGTGAGPMPQSIVTDPTGRFSFGGVSGAMNADKCTLAISKPGFTARSITSPDACFRSTRAHNYGTPCAPTDGRITLTP